MYGDFDVFYWAAKALLSGLSPYTVPGFFNPAWTLIPFIPLTLFSIEISHAIWQVCTVLGILAALWRFHLKPLTIAIVVLASPLMWISVVYGNVDWLVLLGATLAPKWGMWLLSMKPQVSTGSFILSPKMLLVIVPAIVLNYALLGLPDFRTSNTLQTAAADLFPWALPLGIFLVYRSRKTKSAGLALASGAFLSPYYSITSYLALAPLATSWKRTILLLGFTWLVFLIWRSGI
jgi:hypothetical protein